MVEVNSEHIPELFNIFGENANILMGKYINYRNLEFDVIGKYVARLQGY